MSSNKIMQRGMWAVAGAMALALAGCGESPQTTKAAYKQADTPSWQGTDNPYVASGWKPGDQASWEEQMKRRAQGQNDYARAN
jgi:hypothetical protein